MSLLSRISGVVGNLFRIGLGGPQLKNNAGVIEARNVGDTGYAVLRAGTPVGVADLATRAYADLVARTPQLSAPQYPGLGVRLVAKAEGPTLLANGSYTVVDVAGAGFMS